MSSSNSSKPSSSKPLSKPSASASKPLSRLEQLMLSESPAQESLLSNLLQPDLLNMRLAGVQVRPTLTKNLQVKYLFGYCGAEGNGHYVNNMVDYNAGNIIKACSNPNPKTHKPLDEYGCTACIGLWSIQRSGVEDMIVNGGRQTLCKRCTFHLLPVHPIGHDGCTCRNDWRTEWDCGTCWGERMHAIIATFGEVSPGNRNTCPMPGCGRKNTESVLVQHPTIPGIIVNVFGEQCFTCKGFKYRY